MNKDYSSRFGPQMTAQMWTMFWYVWHKCFSIL